MIPKIGCPKTGAASFLPAKRSNVEDTPSIGNPLFSAITFQEA